MADPKELEEAADAILSVRQLPAVGRHPELDGPLRQAEDWARKHYHKVTEQPDDEVRIRLESRQLKLRLH